MDRLLVLRLESVGVVAEAELNGIALGRTSASQRVITIPIHEYTLAGANELSLVIEPPPPGAPVVTQPALSDGQCGATLRLLLPRVGQVAHPENARTLAQIDWAPAAGEVSELPATLRRTVELPIAFPRWRWLDAPVIPDPSAALAVLVPFLQTVALGLARGDPEPLVLATRLKLEDLAQAYQRNLADEVGRLRVHVQQAHARQPLKPVMPKLDTLRLRPLAGGRLLECLGPDGGPALHSPGPEGTKLSWPMRVALIDGRFYGLR